MMTDQEKARRLSELQRHSQAFGGQGPVLVGNSDPTPLGEPAFPGAVEAEEEMPSTTETAARMIADRNESAQNEALRSRMDARSDRGAYNRRRQGYQSSADSGAGMRERQIQTAPTSPLTPDAAAPSLMSLSPAAQASLRQKYESGGHTQTMPFEEWYQDNFTGSFPHEIESAASRTVRVQGGKDPNLQPGQNSAVAKSRMAAGKPLPEGRDASQYSDKQRRTMQRNVHSPEVPMSQFGGTFTHNVDGSVSSRAPNPQMLQTAADIAADKEQGPGSASHTMALAMAYGIDATQYGDDMDLLKADVMREQQRHDALGKSYDVVDNGMGGFRYKFNQDKSNAAVADREAGMSDQRKLQFAKEIYARHRGLTGEDGKPFLTFEDVMNKASTPNGFAELRMLNQSANAMAGGMRAQNVRNNWANRNMTIAANNPMVAQGLYMRSLQEAAQSGDPMQVAAVHSSFGNDRAARDYMSLAGQQADAAAVAVAGEAAARAKAADAPSDKPFAQQFQDEINAALRNPSPEQQRVAIIGILTKMGVVAPEQVEKTADRILASASGGSLNPQHTRTWMEYFFGPSQPAQGPALPPMTAAAPGTAPPAPAAAAPAAPPASGRGASLDAAMDFLSGNRPTLQQNHPYRRGS